MGGAGVAIALVFTGAVDPTPNLVTRFVRALPTKGQLPPTFENFVGHTKSGKYELPYPVIKRSQVAQRFRDLSHSFEDFVKINHEAGSNLHALFVDELSWPVIEDIFPGTGSRIVASHERSILETPF